MSVACIAIAIRQLQKMVQYCSKVRDSYTTVIVDHHIETCRVPLQRGAKPGYLENARVGEDGDALQKVD